ncbi:putative MO25-like protein At5g47540 isoform X3 [Triticum aestivum]|uniref:putative MO25-like protein At5g47540 isoform X3 n=1 Tax=Triticum aestivum TaxID=4565 RepID=UPI001D0242B3|nr:putative MO25-like protein At5g47540 isoform X3 [Triticum aestivum]
MSGCLWPCVSSANAMTGGMGGGLFGPKARSPAELVRHTRDLLRFIADHPEPCSGKLEAKREQKITDLSISVRAMKSILYGDGDGDPVAEACTQLTREFFKDNTLRLVIVCVPHMDLETQKEVTLVFANLARQKVDSRIPASDYLEVNQDLLDILMAGFNNRDIAIHYSTILRDCVRHQVAARYVLYSQHMKKFFDYIQFPDFSPSSEAFKTFKELLTRHKSSAAEFFTKNYDWFFSDFHTKLLHSSNYVTKRQSIQDPSQPIQVEAFHIFKLFTANKNKPRDIISILVANKSKIIRFLNAFTLEKGVSLALIDAEDRVFESDKAQVLVDITALKL